MKKILYLVTLVCIVSVHAQDKKDTRPAYLLMEEQLKKTGQLMPGQPFPYYDEATKRMMLYSAERGMFDPYQVPDTRAGVSQPRATSGLTTTSNFALVKDINTEKDANPSNYALRYSGQAFTVLNNVAYYAADNGINGVELYRSDGTAAGTYLVKDINPGQASSYPQTIIVSNHHLFFSATTASEGVELWTSDGTAAGTTIVKDIYAGPASTYPTRLTNVNGSVFFAAGNNNGHLWSTDGTAAGTRIVKDLYNSAVSSYDLLQLTAVKNLLFFTANSNSTGRELWRSDGTDAGTYLVKDISNTYDDGPEQLTFYDNKLYFSADNGSGRTLWVSDGTAANTTPAPGYNNVLLQSFYFFYSEPFTICDHKLFFPAFTPATGSEMFKYDASSAAGVVLIKNITPGTGSTNLQFAPMVSIDKQVFFSYADSSGSTQLWKSNGSTAGTSLVVNLGKAASYNFFNASGTLLFNSRTDSSGYEVWKSDGTAAGTVEVKDIYRGTGGASPYFYTNCNGLVLFSAKSENAGVELWKTDGTVSGTNLVKDVNKTTTSSSYPSSIAAYNGGVLFSAYKPGKGSELWKSDGTASGTSLVKDLTPGENSGNPFALVSKNNYMYFTYYGTPNSFIYRTDGTAGGTEVAASVTGYIHSYIVTDNGNIIYYIYNSLTLTNQLWKSDGTVAGTVLLANGLNLYNSNYNFQKGTFSGIVSIGNSVYFFALDNTSSSGYELWKTDGTPGGTVMVKDINPGANSSAQSTLIAFNNSLYFGAFNGVENALWRSDGTAAGTKKLKSVSPDNFCMSNNQLFFSGYTSAYGTELWKTDGTPGGTKLVKDINSGSSFSYPYNLTDVNGLLYFSATDDAHGSELWKSNGLAGGTKLVKDVNPGPDYTYFNGLTNSSGKLFFLTNNVLWISDGTGSGTHPVDDTGLPDLSYIYSLTSTGDRLYFNGYSYQYGYELYSGNTSNLTFARAANRAEFILPENKFSASLLANPVKDQLGVLISSKNEQDAQITLTDLAGRKIMGSTRKLSAGSNTISYNTSSWMQGVYIIKIVSADGSTATLKVLK